LSNISYKKEPAEGVVKILHIDTISTLMIVRSRSCE